MRQASEHRVASMVAVALAGGVTALLSATFWVGSTVDEEEFRFAVLSSWFHLDMLRQGSLGLWTSDLGLGVPQPFVPNFTLHPLLPLLAITTPVTWVRVLLVAHTLLGALGMWWAARWLGMPAVVRAACVATFLLATPVLNHVLSDFWLSHFIVWTSAPWLLLFAWRALEAEGRRLAFWSVALGVSLGLVAASANPGHLLVYTPLAGAAALTHVRQLLARWRWLLVTVVIAGAIAAPNLVLLATERSLFPPGLPLGLGHEDTPLPPAAAWTAVAGRWGGIAEEPFTRTLFFGGPFALLALAGGVVAARRFPELVVAMATGVLLLFTTVVPLPYVAARFHLRDLVTLAGILLAGLALSRLATSRLRLLAGVIVLVQLAALSAGAWPVLMQAWSDEARRAHWFRAAAGEFPVIDAVVRLAAPVGRMVLTPSLDADVFDGNRVGDGLGVNTLAYRELPVLNGWFKGVSANAVWPDERLFYGRIAAPQALIESPASLDVLGIRWVLSHAGDAVGPTLRHAGDIPLSKEVQLTLYENPDAIAGGFFVDSTAANLAPAAFPGCDNSRLLCTDLAALDARRLADPVTVTARHGYIDVQVLPAAQPRLLVLSQMFRPDWVATAPGGPLQTLQVLDGLLAVSVPAGVTSIEVRYRPIARVAAVSAAWLAIVAGAVSLIWLRPSPADVGDPPAPGNTKTE